MANMLVCTVRMKVKHLPEIICIDFGLTTLTIKGELMSHYFRMLQKPHFSMTQYVHLHVCVSGYSVWHVDPSV